MNIETTVTLSEEHLQRAEKLVEDGHYPSVSSVVEAGLAQLYGAQDAVSADPLAGMGDEIRRRMELPRDQWISMEEDDLFDRVRERLQKHRSKK